MRLSDLTTTQIRLMARVAGPYTDEDAVGLELREITEADWPTVLELVKLDLLRLYAGEWRSAWFTLTDKGRKVRETGEA